MNIEFARSPPAVWDRVVCGIDGTAASLEAARRVAALMPAAAKLTLCAVIIPGLIEGDVSMEQALTHDSELALDHAQREIAASHQSEAVLREGPPVRLLLDELIADRATLIAVGSRGHDRAAGAGLGTVATAMLRDAPCSVLIAHGGSRDETGSDGEIVVGFDGSGGARRALAAGSALAERVSMKLRVIVATGDAQPPGEGWSREELGAEPAVSEDPRPAVDALVDASGAAALLIVGSRHLPGATTIASVSEQVARDASCPVLVVR